MQSSDLKLNPEKLKKTIEHLMETQLVPTLKEFINIPNLSRNFDASFFENGLIQQANELYLEWAKKQNIKGVKRLEIIHEVKPITPLLLMVVEASHPDIDSTVL